ncbi:unnamed protein product, partial [marine sediment metagenome]
MDKKILVFSFVFALVIAGLIFVFAAPSAPTALNFTENTTPTFDKEGIFFVNWTTGGGDEVNYTIWISIDGGSNWFNNTSNDSATGYAFSNQTDANYTFQIEAINDTLDGANSTSTISIVVDDTAPAIEYGTGMAANAANSTDNFIYVNVTAT